MRGQFVNDLFRALYLKPAAFSCTKAFKAHQLETASHLYWLMAMDKICLQLDKDTRFSWLLGPEWLFALLWAFSDFMPQVILQWSSQVLLETLKLLGSSQSLLHTLCLGTSVPPNPGSSQAGLQLPQGATWPNKPVPTSGPSRLSCLMEICPILPFFPPDEHFLGQNGTCPLSAKPQGRARLENGTSQ